MNTQLAEGEIGYLYCTTHIPTGLMYVGSRKGSPDGDSYLGSPKGKNKMRELFDTRDPSEFEKVVLYVSDHTSITSDEPALIKAMQDQFGDLVTNIMTCFPPPPRYGEDHHQYGKPFPPEQLAKMSAAKAGKPLSEEHSSKISAALKGREFSEEHRKNLSLAQPKRAVINVETGETWESADAADKALGLYKNGTWKRIDGKLFRGIWQYVDDQYERSDELRNKTRGATNRKSVINIKTGETWESAIDADRALSLSTNTTAQRINKKLFGGIWQYVDEQYEPSDELINRHRGSASCKPVINIKTGQEWSSATLADKELGLSKGVTTMRILKKSFGGIWQLKQEQINE